MDDQYLRTGRSALEFGRTVQIPGKHNLPFLEATVQADFKGKVDAS